MRVKDQQAAVGDLPARLLSSLLGHVPDLAQSTHDLLAPAAAVRTGLRQRLADEGRIHSIDTGLIPSAVHAVDGALVKQSWYAADFYAAVAVRAPGLQAQGAEASYDSYASVLPRGMDTDRAATLSMFSLELGLLAEPTDAIVAMDGSFGTPALAAVTTLPSVGKEAAAAVFDAAAMRFLPGIDAIVDPGRRIIALPKADTSRALSEAWSQEFDMVLPPSDKLLATEILRPGEYLAPTPAMGLSHVDVVIPDDALPQVRLFLQDLDTHLHRLRALAASGGIQTTYLKPVGCTTVIKLEFRTNGPDTLDELVAAVAADTQGPHIQEPFCQFIADRAAKSASASVDAMRAALARSLPEGSHEYASWLLTDYRTTRRP